jgi:hypothetical protein
MKIGMASRFGAVFCLIALTSCGTPQVANPTKPPAIATSPTRDQARSPANLHIVPEKGIGTTPSLGREHCQPSAWSSEMQAVPELYLRDGYDAVGNIAAKLRECRDEHLRETCSCQQMRAPAYRLFEAREAAIAARIEPAARYGFPRSARLVEWQAVPAGVHRARALVLWMERSYASVQSSASYSCPGTTLGSHYIGPTRVSLVDTDHERLLSTLELQYDLDRAKAMLQQWDEPAQQIERDFMAIPFGLPDRGFHGDVPLEFRYGAPGGTLEQPAEVELLSFLDYTGDGDSIEFALFDTEACVGLRTALIGYSRRRDHVVWYPVIVNGKRQLWVDSWLTHAPVAPGRWRYSLNYQGRGGAGDAYDIHYEPNLEAFVGSRRAIAP